MKISILATQKIIIRAIEMPTLKSGLRMTPNAIKGLTKSKIRSKILTILVKQKEEDRLKKSEIIKEKLFKSKAFRKAKRVMFYLAFGKEVKTRKMIREAQRQGKIVAVPVCDRKKKKIIPSKIGIKEKFKKGLYGIKVPVCLRPLAKKDIDLVIVPGVAFDRKGNRLGRGKGYYDSFLKTLSKKTFSIGLAFDFQVLPSLPPEPHDIAVTKVLSA